MPRRARISTGGLAYHILNRRVGRLALFDKPADYMAFENILNEAHERTGIRIAAYCLIAQPLAPCFVAARRWRALRSDALDHGDAHAALACASAEFWERAGLPGAFQILSGANR